MSLLPKIIGLILLIQITNGIIYNEELFVENLSNSHVHLQFQFNSVWDDLNEEKSGKLLQNIIE